MTVYLARPIDLADPQYREQTQAMEDVATDILLDHGHSIYRPGEAWKVPLDRYPDERQALLLCDINEHARSHSRMVVAIVPTSMTSIGVPAEIALSVASGIYTIIYTEPNRMGSWIVTAWNAALRAQGRGGVATTAGELRSLIAQGTKVTE